MASARLTRATLAGTASAAAIGLGGLAIGASPATAAPQISVDGECTLTITVDGLLPDQAGSLSANVGDTYVRSAAQADGNGTVTWTVAEGQLPDGSGQVRWYSRGQNPDAPFETAAESITVSCDSPTPTSTSSEPTPTSSTSEPSPTSSTSEPTPTDTSTAPEPTGTSTAPEPTEPSDSDTSEPTNPAEPTSHTTSGPEVETGVDDGGVSNGLVGLAALTITGGVVAAGAAARRRLHDED